MRKQTLMLFASVIPLFYSCDKKGNEQRTFETQVQTDKKGYSYETVAGDPLKARIYTLDNGLKVYLSKYAASPRIQTYIAVKAGGKNDPSNATGLAHYLEHMMFKGTADFGTLDWEKEKTMLDSIENMFNHYSTLTDVEERKTYYAKIDKVSKEASNYAIANEYDKMVSNLGAKGTNAYTNSDRTVYVNDIPANELDKWLEVEANRFGKIVNRLFHTELEAVYEEKNRSLDNDFWQVYETMDALLFPDHKYGQQTVIGTIEHLKNPSITEIKNYFDKYYIPNNVAICLSGDLDYDATIEKINKHFSAWEKKELETYKVQPSASLSENKEADVWGPDAASVMMAFKFPGQTSEERVVASLCDMILSNSTAGLIDLNLKQAQKVIDPYSSIYFRNDHGAHLFQGTPREGQTLEEVRDLLLAQIEKVKKGEFEDWLIEAIVNDFKKYKIKALENNRNRADEFVIAFTNDLKWSDYVDDLDQMKKLTKEDVVAFANKYYTNYAVVYKRTGENPNKKSVEKPQISQVELNRDKASDFLTRINAQESGELKPSFLDYEKDVVIKKMKADIPVWYKKNEENDLFKLYYQIDRGSNNNPKLSTAVNYLEFLGTADLSAVELKKEFYKLGCNYSVYAGNEKVYISLSGLEENFETALQLFEKLIRTAQPDQKALEQMISANIKERDDNKKSKGKILFAGLNSYAKYGSESPLTSVLSNQQLKNLEVNELTDIIHNMLNSEHKVLYYGSKSVDKLVTSLNEHHDVPEELKALPALKTFPTQDMNNPKVYWTNYDMVQAEVIFLAKADAYDAKREAAATLFNEYFGGGMGSIVFTEMRESKALAYSVWSNYKVAKDKSRDDYMFAYIGSQVDKLGDAMAGMDELLRELPTQEKAFNTAKASLLKKLESERVLRESVLFDYEAAQKKGLNKDIRKDIYEHVKNMTMQDVQDFHTEFIKTRKYNIAVIGDKDKLDRKVLAKYGKVEEVKVDDLFNYEKGIQLLEQN